MNEELQPAEQAIFDAKTWAELPDILGKLPQPIRLTVWGDPAASDGEREATVLCQTLADHFDKIKYRFLPRRVNYPYYPVLGVMGEAGEQEIDYGVRIIGLPSGYQMTSLITAIQAVAFQGMTLEPITRIKLSQLQKEANIELMTSAENEGGPLMAKIIFGLAVASPHIRSYLIMSDRFPEANLRYSVKQIPHTVINGRVHVEGVVEEDAILMHLAMAVKVGS
jgi:alkyl hydroperoxide reductase subunit AhpF